jgi:biotin operon repressor
MPTDYLAHTGVLHRSGRYKWGSGKKPEQSGASVRGVDKVLKNEGLGLVERAKAQGMKTTQLRKQISLERDAEKLAKASQALYLKDKGLSPTAIAEVMGLPNESSARSLLRPALLERAQTTEKICQVLRDEVAQSRYVDVGAMVDMQLGITRTKLDTSIYKLQKEGYVLRYHKVVQAGTGKPTSLRALCAPGVTPKEFRENFEKMRMVGKKYSLDGGLSWETIKTPTNVSLKRILVKYKDDGGGDKDGVIEVRRGVEDLSLGKLNYMQVRVAVEGTHYMKGMAIHGDNMPPGIDIIYNTSKKAGTPILGDKDNSVMKPMKSDPDNPFGSTIRQMTYKGKDGKEHLSALNTVGSEESPNEEGRWANWQKSLSSQVLSKQRTPLAKQQLKAKAIAKEKEYNEIMALTNPTVKKFLLAKFADSCDSESVHLKAAALPRQGSHVLLPVLSLKENEVYAPGYRPGEPVVLIRHPHGGTFEIPELIVNNNNAEAKRIYKNSEDFVGINPKVAARLSGADFDGDAVIVIPNHNGQIKTRAALPDLQGFDPKEHYKLPPEAPDMKNQRMQTLMGEASNLITDMTIQGAGWDKIARAVKYSMVVIDAKKHRLNHSKAAKDFGIADLKTEYQGGPKNGAATLVSRAKSQYRAPYREVSRNDPLHPEIKRGINSITGEKAYTVVGGSYIKKGIPGEDGKRGTKDKVVFRTTKISKMENVTDALELSSGTEMEKVYGDHANTMKSLANKARKSYLETPLLNYSPSAAKTYDAEVKSLKAELNKALIKKPNERNAQILCGKIVENKKAQNPSMEPEEIKKIRGQALKEARYRLDANKDKVTIDAKRWEAIQAGAISDHKLMQILQNGDVDAIKELAMPRTIVSLSKGQQSRARSMLNNGATKAEIAEALGISTTTLKKFLE